MDESQKQELVGQHCPITLSDQVFTCHIEWIREGLNQAFQSKLNLNQI